MQCDGEMDCAEGLDEWDVLCSKSDKLFYRQHMDIFYRAHAEFCGRVQPIYCHTLTKFCMCGVQFQIIISDKSGGEECRAGEFRCHSDGSCIPGDWRCDGVVDCSRDAADEENCSKCCMQWSVLH